MVCNKMELKQIKNYKQKNIFNHKDSNGIKQFIKTKIHLKETKWNRNVPKPNKKKLMKFRNKIRK